VAVGDPDHPSPFGWRAGHSHIATEVDQHAAGSGGRAAAILLPLYYLADSTITLIRRARNGEKVWRAHRSHFYQRATDRGFSVLAVVARVFIVNLALAALAIVTVIVRSRTADIAALSAGVALVAGLLYALTRGRSAE